MRTARILGQGPVCYYHCMSRVIERKHVLDDSEKERFRKTMRKVAAFSGVEILTYALMGNHMHLLIKVPEPEELSEEQVLARIRGLYGRVRAVQVASELAALRDENMHEQAAALLQGYTHRMYDLSEYMKMLMQRFTQSYNRRHKRRGTLWEDRFKSILVEGKPGALCAMAAYIDLNAVRAGAVQDPRDYRFCGYGEAVAGGQDARRGIGRICEILGREAAWRSAGRVYRKHLFMQAQAHTKHGCTASGEKIEQVIAQGGKLSMGELLRCRVRYFSDGVVLGSKAFVEDVFQANRAQFGLKRRSGARRPRHGQWAGLCFMRDLRLDPVSAPVSR